MLLMLQITFREGPDAITFNCWQVQDSDYNLEFKVSFILFSDGP